MHLFVATSLLVGVLSACLDDWHSQFSPSLGIQICKGFYWIHSHFVFLLQMHFFLNHFLQISLSRTLDFVWRFWCRMWWILWLIFFFSEPLVLEKFKNWRTTDSGYLKKNQNHRITSFDYFKSPNTRQVSWKNCWVSRQLFGFFKIHWELLLYIIIRYLNFFFDNHSLYTGIRYLIFWKPHLSTLRITLIPDGHLVGALPNTPPHLFGASKTSGPVCHYYIHLY